MKLTRIAATAIVLFIGVTGDLALYEASASATTQTAAARSVSVGPVTHHAVSHARKADPFVISH